MQNQLTSEMQALSQDEEFQELIVMFLDDVREQAAQIKAAYEAEDFERVRKVSHQIKGSAGGYGFQDLSEFAKTAEHACREQLPNGERSTAIEQLLEACDAVTA